MRSLAATLLSARSLRLVLEGSPTGDVSLSAQRWELGDTCVTVVASTPLPAGFDEDTLSSAVLALLARAHDREEMEQAPRREGAAGGGRAPDADRVESSSPAVAASPRRVRHERRDERHEAIGDEADAAGRRPLEARTQRGDDSDVHHTTTEEPT